LAKSKNKKDYGRPIRILEDICLALEIIAKKGYRSIPQQVDKFLRENSEIKKNISVENKKKKKKDLKERYDDYNITRVLKSTMKKIAIIAENNNRSITKQVDKYLTEAMAREKKKGSKK